MLDFKVKCDYKGNSLIYKSGRGADVSVTINEEGSIISYEINGVDFGCNLDSCKGILIDIGTKLEPRPFAVAAILDLAIGYGLKNMKQQIVTN